MVVRPLLCCHVRDLLKAAVFCDRTLNIEKQKGHYYAYVKNSEGEEADTYILQTWDVYKGDNSCYEVLLTLYYAPLNPYLTYKKHMGENWAQEYLDELTLVGN